MRFNNPVTPVITTGERIAYWFCRVLLNRVSTIPTVINRPLNDSVAKIGAPVRASGSRVDGVVGGTFGVGEPEGTSGCSGLSGSTGRSGSSGVGLPGVMCSFDGVGGVSPPGVLPWIVAVLETCALLRSSWVTV